MRSFSRCATPLLSAALLATSACAAVTGGEPNAGRPPARECPVWGEEMILEYRPADPVILQRYLDRRKAEGASDAEGARIRELLEIARAFAVVDAARVRVPAGQKAHFDRLFTLLSDHLADEARRVLSDGGAQEKKEIEVQKLDAPKKRTSLDEEIKQAASADDRIRLETLLRQVESQNAWGELSLVSVWTLSQTLAANQRFGAAVDQLVPRAEERAGDPALAEIWLALGRWELADGDYEQARPALERVVSEYDASAARVREAETMLRGLENRSDAQEREMMARLVEAEAIVEHGSDFRRALSLSETVRQQFRGTELARRAEDLARRIREQSAERVRTELNSLWSRFEEGAPLEDILQRIGWLSERTIGEEPQARLVRAREEFKQAEIDRRMNRMRTREERIEALWGQAQEAEKDGHYEDAIVLYRELADSPKHKQAIERLKLTIDKLVEHRRSEAGELLLRALETEDAEKRLVALKRVEARLEDLLDRFPEYGKADRVKADLIQVRREIERTQAAAGGQPSAEVGSEAG